MTNLPKIGKLAKEALATVGIDQVEQLTGVTKANLANLHGVGPKAIKILEESMLELGLSFDAGGSAWPKAPFFLVGDLACDNVPKRQFARDVAVGLYAQGFAGQDPALVSDDVVYRAPYTGVELVGRDQVVEGFVGVADVSSMEVFQILSHGKEAALHGRIADKRGGMTYFSIFYEFTGHKKAAPISKIVHYQQIQG